MALEIQAFRTTPAARGRWPRHEAALTEMVG
jgi:hypothetical protein